MGELEQFFGGDIAGVEIKVKGGSTHALNTAEEASCEPVLEEGESRSVNKSGKILAKKETPDSVTGHDITLRDLAFTPKVLADVQGGTVTEGSSPTKFKKYTAPNCGAIKNTKKFDLVVYVEVVGEDGETGEYLKVTLPNCTGSFISPNFKDGEFFVTEYTIKSRPALNTSLYEIDLVSELPDGVYLLRHPLIEAMEENQVVEQREIIKPNN